jgi:hypothetical protein
MIESINAETVPEAEKLDKFRMPLQGRVKLILQALAMALAIQKMRLQELQELQLAHLAQVKEIPLMTPPSGENSPPVFTGLTLPAQPILFPAPAQLMIPPQLPGLGFVPTGLGLFGQMANGLLPQMPSPQLEMLLLMQGKN